MSDTRRVFNQHDGITGRDGGPYLDQIEAYNAEVRRAQIENREPDFDNPGSTAGAPLVPAAVLKYGVGVNSTPSQGDIDTNQLAVEALADDENVLLQPKGEGVFRAAGEVVEEDEVEQSEDEGLF